MSLRFIPVLALIATAASPAFAASDEHGGGGFIGGFLYSLNDPVTHTAALALAVFLFIAWRLGALKAILGGLDKRADTIRNELEEAQNLREQAAEALALAERRQQDADKEADAMIAQAKKDAKRIMEEARKDIADRLARREALAEARITRAETEATEEVRRAAADAATAAAKQLLAEDTAIDQFEAAAREIERALS